MTISTSNNALRYFLHDSGLLVIHHVTYADELFNSIFMVELQAWDSCLTTVDTWILREVFIDKCSIPISNFLLSLLSLLLAFRCAIACFVIHFLASFTPMILSALGFVSPTKLLCRICFAAFGASFHTLCLTPTRTVQIY